MYNIYLYNTIYLYIDEGDRSRRESFKSMLNKESRDVSDGRKPYVDRWGLRSDIRNKKGKYYTVRHHYHHYIGMLY